MLVICETTVLLLNAYIKANFTIDGELRIVPFKAMHKNVGLIKADIDGGIHLWLWCSGAEPNDDFCKVITSVHAEGSEAQYDKLTATREDGRKVEVCVSRERVLSFSIEVHQH
jgi:hypothetical protein